MSIFRTTFKEEPSDIKAIAVVFDAIGKTQSITKDRLQELLSELGKNGGPVGEVLQKILKIFHEDELVHSVLKDREFSRLLRRLVNNAYEQMQTIKNDKVAPAISARAELLLSSRPSSQ